MKKMKDMEIKNGTKIKKGCYVRAFLPYTLRSGDRIAGKINAIGKPVKHKGKKVGIIIDQFKTKDGIELLCKIDEDIGG